jgi:hypothetical protein
MFFTSGTTGNPKGVVHTHNALIDRAQAGAEFDHLTSAEEVLAYLPVAWIGQNIFSYAQWLVCGYVVNCPESVATTTIDLKEIGPTYYFAPPRVFEGLLTSVMIRMEDASAPKRWLFRFFMDLARRVGPARMDGSAVLAAVPSTALNWQRGEMMTRFLSVRPASLMGVNSCDGIFFPPSLRFLFSTRSYRPRNAGATSDAKRFATGRLLVTTCSERPTRSRATS